MYEKVLYNYIARIHRIARITLSLCVVIRGVSMFEMLEYELKVKTAGHIIWNSLHDNIVLCNIQV